MPSKSGASVLGFKEKPPTVPLFRVKAIYDCLLFEEIPVEEGVKRIDKTPIHF